MKKIIAIILSLTIALSVGIPAFAVDEEITPPDSVGEEITDPSDTEEGEGDGDSPAVEDKEPLTDEEIEAIRKAEALSVFDSVRESATEGLLGLVMLPFVPVMLIVPVFGWVTSLAAITSPIVLLSVPFRFIIACFEAADIYANFDAGAYQAIA